MIDRVQQPQKGKSRQGGVQPARQHASPQAGSAPAQAEPASFVLAGAGAASSRLLAAQRMQAAAGFGGALGNRSLQRLLAPSPASAAALDFNDRAPALLQLQPDDPAPAAAVEVFTLEDEIKELQDEYDDQALDQGTVQDYARLRRTILLLQASPQKTFPDEDARDAVIDHAEEVADSDYYTFEVLDTKESYLDQYPRAFPDILADEAEQAFSLGPEVLQQAQQEADAALKALNSLEAIIPDQLVSQGLPVDKAEALKLSSFELKFEHAQLGDPHIVRTVAQFAQRYAMLAAAPASLASWRQFVAGYIESIRSGDETANYAALKHFAAAKGAYPSELLQGGPIAADDDPQQIYFAHLQSEARTFGFIQGALMFPRMGAGFQVGADLFARGLAAADKLIASASFGEDLVRAIDWAIQYNYFGEKVAEIWRGIRENYESILTNMGLLIGVQFIPGVDIVVDLYLSIKYGFDLVSNLMDLVSAIYDAGSAKSVVGLQKAAAHLADASIETLDLFVEQYAQDVAMKGATAVGKRIIKGKDVSAGEPETPEVEPESGRTPDQPGRTPDQPRKEPAQPEEKTPTEPVKEPEPEEKGRRKAPAKVVRQTEFTDAWGESHTLTKMEDGRIIICSDPRCMVLAEAVNHRAERVKGWLPESNAAHQQIAELQKTAGDIKKRSEGLAEKTPEEEKLWEEAQQAAEKISEIEKRAVTEIQVESLSAKDGLNKLWKEVSSKPEVKQALDANKDLKARVHNELIRLDKEWASTAEITKGKMDDVMRQAVGDEFARIKKEAQDLTKEVQELAPDKITPAFITENRVPLDRETFLADDKVYTRTSMNMMGATVYRGPGGDYYHLDTLHTGKAAEIEYYDSTGNHLGALNPVSGEFIPGSKVEGRYLKSLGK